MIDERKNGVGESTLTIKWWAILIVFISIFGWFFVTALAHENRLTKVETTIEQNLCTIKADLQWLKEKHMVGSK